MEKSREIQIMRPTQPMNEITNKLEAGLQYGAVILLENVIEVIEPVFESILL